MKYLLAAVTALQLCCISKAQSVPNLPQQGRETGPVSVIFTVMGEDGKFVTDLKVKEFKVLDNERAPAQILNFEPRTDLPLRIGMLIDAGHQGNEQHFLIVKEAAGEFLQKVIRPQSDKAFVLAFDEIPDVVQDFTGDVGELAAGIRRIRPGGGLAMWDAIYYACRDKMMKEKNSTTVRRAIVILSDGDDKESRVLPREAIEMAQRAGVAVFAISTKPGDTHTVGDRNLQMLAESTGGRAFYPLRLEDISRSLTQIKEEIHNQYAILYWPADVEANGQFHTIQIVPEDKKLKVRASKGYFAPKR